MKRPLILLFGMPRSGTTWIGKIFDSHPDTLYRHEPDSRGTLNTLPLFASASEAEEYRAFLEQYVAQLPDIRDEKVSASLPVFAKSYYTPLQLALRKMVVFGTKVASRFLGAIPVPDLVKVHSHSQISVVWKSIESLGRLGVLARVFPESRCVIILRHPCGYVASVLSGEARKKFEGSTPSGEDWGMYTKLLNLDSARKRALDMQTVQSMSAVERLALKWALYYEHALTETAGMENVIVVRYEDFCERPLEEAQQAFRHCRLRWAPETERFIASSTSHENTEYYSVFKNPEVSAWKWRNDLSASDVEQIMGVVSRFQFEDLLPTIPSS
ncbi:MAG: sulfotransferase [Nitrosomonadales bacterium]|nr:sulfotransferase [Nitrosomonadales bacterium]